jgi:hypothetical protein
MPGLEHLPPWVSAVALLGAMIFGFIYAAKKGVKFLGGVSEEQYQLLLVKVDSYRDQLDEYNDRLDDYNKRLYGVEQLLAVNVEWRRNIEEWQRSQDNRMTKMEARQDQLDRRVSFRKGGTS